MPFSSGPWDEGNSRPSCFLGGLWLQLPLGAEHSALFGPPRLNTVQPWASPERRWRLCTLLPQVNTITLKLGWA